MMSVDHDKQDVRGWLRCWTTPVLEGKHLEQLGHRGILCSLTHWQCYKAWLMQQTSYTSTLADSREHVTCHQAQSGLEIPPIPAVRVPAARPSVVSTDAIAMVCDCYGRLTRPPCHLRQNVLTSRHRCSHCGRTLASTRAMCPPALPYAHPYPYIGYGPG